MVTRGHGLAAFALCVWCALPSIGQVTGSEKLTAKSLEAAASFAQSLAQWEFVIFGASMLVLVGTSYYRPQRPWQAIYLLFLPAWGCLGYSIYRGMKAQEAYLAYMLLPVTTMEGATSALNKDILAQIFWMWWGLGCFSFWLFFYLIWWTFFKKAAQA